MTTKMPERLTIYTCPVCGAVGSSPGSVKLAPYGGVPYANRCWDTAQHAEPVETVFYRQARLTPNGDWVRRLVSDWAFDDDANEGRSIAENDAIQAEHHA